jgi:hypothetical protein
MADTIVMEEPRVTSPQPASRPRDSQPDLQPQQYAAPPKTRSSKMWVWVLLILGVLVLLCGGGGIFGYFVFKSAQHDLTAALANADFNFNRPTSSTPLGNRTTTSTDSASGRTDVTQVDLDMFVRKISLYGTTEMNGDELTMGSIRKDYYYVMVARDKDADDEPIDTYKTKDADVRVTLRNPANADSSFGYGLVFHSNPEPLQQDYAFLIDTKRKKYRIVHHEPQKEIPVVKWTASPAIKGGTEENTLEVRDLPDKIEFYINETLVTSITNVYGYPGGVAGLYSGDGVKIAFKDLQIRR